MCELERYPAPIVAAVRGYAVGGALEFLLFTDNVIAGDNAQFGFPEINHGLLPATKGMRQAATLLGQRAARSLLYSGRLVDAERAREIGIVDEIVAVEQVDVRAVALAREMRDKDQHLFAAIKRSVGCTFQLSDSELEQMTVDDMRAYLDRGETADARARFLNRK
jgi:enoyl-CoA hydratase/carnithine racemase